MRPAFEVADVLRLHGEAFRSQYRLSKHQLRTLAAIERCRTAALGGHVLTCDNCGTLRIAYNSCRNRHCPKCQCVEREAWMLARQAELLPVPYYHVVFTLPAELNGLCLFNQKTMYNLLFRSAWQTLCTFAADKKWLGAKTGATMVLHTWGQNLMLHPHVHCIVPGGGLDTGGNWNPAKKGRRFLFPVKAMSRVFRAIFLKELLLHIGAEDFILPAGFPEGKALKKWRQGLYEKPWVVYAKRPFGGPAQVVEYLGRYTHKTAISNHRLLEVNQGCVRFRYKDYRRGGKVGEMTLSGLEFLRRFSHHILPPGFRRMRHYGILSNALKGRALAACRRSLGLPAPEATPLTRQERRAEALQKLAGQAPDLCPHCREGHMVKVGFFPPQRAPPQGCMPRWFVFEEA